MRIAEVMNRELTWTQPSMWKSRYELLAGGTPVAQLQYEGMLQLRARIESADGCWELRYRGFWQRDLDVTPCGSQQVLGSYHRGFWRGGGALEFAFDRSLVVRANAWRNEISVTLPDNDQVLIRCTRPSIWKIGGVVSIQPGATLLNNLPLVVMLAWFAQVQQIRDQMAAAA